MWYIYLGLGSEWVPLSTVTWNWPLQVLYGALCALGSYYVAGLGLLYDQKSEPAVARRD
jgi:hypothetical protein